MENEEIDATPMPGTRLDEEAAMTLISRFRRKFHQGPPERLLPVESATKAAKKYRQMVKDSGNARLPEDIAEFRREHYGTEADHWPLVWATMILTWLVFPPTSIYSNRKILFHEDFLKHEHVYLSVWSSGEEIHQASAAQVQEFMLDKNRPNNRDYYIFDESLKWCIAVTHDDEFIVAGDFKIF
jgi:hypothetical protein